jgi:hypothetical protein
MIRTSVLGANITTNAAAVAAACSPAITTAEAQGLGDLLTILSRRPDLLQNALQLSNGSSSSAKMNINVT